ncbi:MAG TPA: TetR/AcrR family transcriptional regulator [Kineobactrum sp.]
MATSGHGAAQKNYHHGNLRAALLDSAVSQLEELGTESLSLRALARGIGVSQTAPYRHFSDKSELLAAMATQGYRRLLARLEHAATTTEDCPRAQLAALAHAYVAYAGEYPHMFKLMFGPRYSRPTCIRNCAKLAATPSSRCNLSSTTGLNWASFASRISPT